MKTSEKITRLDQFEIHNIANIWPEYNLIKQARRVSRALFRYDGLCCGMDYAHIEENDNGEPHFFRHTRNGVIDCGKIWNMPKIAEKLVDDINKWFKAAGREDVVAKLDGDLRYISICCGNNKYALID